MTCTIEAKLQKTWTKSEKIQIIYLHDGFYQVVFNSQEDYKFSLYEGPHRVVDHYLILQCWRPFFVMNVKKAKNVVVWVCIQHLLIELYRYGRLTLPNLLKAGMGHIFWYMMAQFIRP